MLILRKKSQHMEISMPIKLFDAIKLELPIITNKETVAGNFVEENNIGWQIENSGNRLLELIRHLLNNKEIFHKKRNISLIRDIHTWKMRAQYVSEILTKKK